MLEIHIMILYDVGCAGTFSSKQLLAV